MTKIRLLVGDTISTEQQLQDEEIYFVLAAQPVVTYAAADCAELLSSKYARQVNTVNSALSVFAAARHKHYLDMAKRLRANGPGETPGGESAGATVATMFAGGISISANETMANDSDAVLPQFKVGEDDFPGPQNGLK